MYEADQPARTNHANSAHEVEAPLTISVMQRTTSAAEMAAEISSRLYSLRDRLFGSPAETADGSKARPQSLGTNFASSFADRAGDLYSALVQIDRLSSELNNRL